MRGEPNEHLQLHVHLGLHGALGLRLGLGPQLGSRQPFPEIGVLSGLGHTRHPLVLEATLPCLPAGNPRRRGE